jgi:hypothetical protein
MSRALSLACAALAFVGTAGLASADTIITFDNLVTGELVADQYRGLGVVFGRNWVGQGPSPFTNAVSGTNSVQFFDPTDVTMNYTVTVDFVIPGTSTPAAVTEIAFTPTDSSTNGTHFFMRAYNTQGFEIGAVESFVDADGVYNPAIDLEVVYTAPADQTIAHVEISVSNTAGPRVIEGDNFRFGPLILPPCGPADVGIGGGLPGHDHVLDNNDFIAFITLFFNSDPIADMGIGAGLPGSDGLYDNNDFIAFINHFFAGC